MSHGVALQTHQLIWLYGEQDFTVRHVFMKLLRPQGQRFQDCKPHSRPVIDMLGKQVVTCSWSEDKGGVGCVVLVILMSRTSPP